MFIVHAVYSPETKSCIVTFTDHVFLNVGFFASMFSNVPIKPQGYELISGTYSNGFRLYHLVLHCYSALEAKDPFRFVAFAFPRRSHVLLSHILLQCCPCGKYPGHPLSHAEPGIILISRSSMSSI